MGYLTAGLRLDLGRDVPEEGPTGVPVPREGPTVLGFFGNLLGDLGEFAGGLAQLGAVAATDLFKGIGEVVTLGQADFDYQLDDVAINLTGWDWLAGRPVKSMVVEDFKARYGGKGASEVARNLYENPLHYIGDILTVASVGSYGAAKAVQYADKARFASELGAIGKGELTTGAIARATGSVADEGGRLTQWIRGKPTEVVDPYSGKVLRYDPAFSPYRRLHQTVVEKLGSSPIDDVRKGLAAAEQELALDPGNVALANRITQLQQAVQTAERLGLRIEKRSYAIGRYRRFTDRWIGTASHRYISERNRMTQVFKRIFEELPDEVSADLTFNTMQLLDPAAVIDDLADGSQRLTQVAELARSLSDKNLGLPDVFEALRVVTDPEQFKPAARAKALGDLIDLEADEYNLLTEFIHTSSPTTVVPAYEVLRERALRYAQNRPWVEPILRDEGALTRLGWTITHPDGEVIGEMSGSLDSNGHLLLAPLSRKVARAVDEPTEGAAGIAAVKREVMSEQAMAIELDNMASPTRTMNTAYEAEAILRGLDEAGAAGARNFDEVWPHIDAEYQRYYSPETPEERVAFGAASDQLRERLRAFWPEAPRGRPVTGLGPDTLASIVDDILRLEPSATSVRMGDVDLTPTPLPVSTEPRVAWSLPHLGVSEVRAAEYAAARQGMRSTFAQHIDFPDPVDLQNTGARMYLTDGGEGGYYVTAEGELSGLFTTPDAPRGTGKTLVLHALEEAEKQGQTLRVSHFDGHLTRYFSMFGFRPTAFEAFDVAKAPKGWNYATQGQPHVVHMTYEGGPVGNLAERYGRFAPIDTRYREILGPQDVVGEGAGAPVRPELFGGQPGAAGPGVGASEPPGTLRDRLTGIMEYWLDDPSTVTTDELLSALGYGGFGSSAHAVMMQDLRMLDAGVVTSPVQARRLQLLGETVAKMDPDVDAWYHYLERERSQYVAQHGPVPGPHALWSPLLDEWVTGELEVRPDAIINYTLRRQDGSIYGHARGQMRPDGVAHIDTAAIGPYWDGGYSSGSTHGYVLRQFDAAGNVVREEAVGHRLAELSAEDNIVNLYEQWGGDRNHVVWEFGEETKKRPMEPGEERMLNADVYSKYQVPPDHVYRLAGGHTDLPDGGRIELVQVDTLERSWLMDFAEQVIDRHPEVFRFEATRATGGIEARKGMHTINKNIPNALRERIRVMRPDIAAGDVNRTRYDLLEQAFRDRMAAFAGTDPDAAMFQRFFADDELVASEVMEQVGSPYDFNRAPAWAPQAVGGDRIVLAQLGETGVDQLEGGVDALAIGEGVRFDVGDPHPQMPGIELRRLDPTDPLIRRMMGHLESTTPVRMNIGELAEGTLVQGVDPAGVPIRGRVSSRGFDVDSGRLFINVEEGDRRFASVIDANKPEGVSVVSETPWDNSLPAFNAEELRVARAVLERLDVPVSVEPYRAALLANENPTWNDVIEAVTAHPDGARSLGEALGPVWGADEQTRILTLRSGATETISRQGFMVTSLQDMRPLAEALVVGGDSVIDMRGGQMSALIDTGAVASIDGRPVGAYRDEAALQARLERAGYVGPQAPHDAAAEMAQVLDGRATADAVTRLRSLEPADLWGIVHKARKTVPTREQLGEAFRTVRIKQPPLPEVRNTRRLMDLTEHEGLLPGLPRTGEYGDPLVWTGARETFAEDAKNVQFGVQETLAPVFGYDRIEGRVKSPEAITDNTVLASMLTGREVGFNELDDLVSFSVVVDNYASMADAVRRIQELGFPVHRVLNELFRAGEGGERRMRLVVSAGGQPVEIKLLTDQGYGVELANRGLRAWWKRETARATADPANAPPAEEFEAAKRLLEANNEALVDELLGEFTGFQPNAMRRVMLQARLAIAENFEAPEFIADAGFSPLAALERNYRPMDVQRGAWFDQKSGSWVGGRNSIFDYDDQIRDAGLPMPVYFPYYDRARLKRSDWVMAKRTQAILQYTRPGHEKRFTGHLLKHDLEPRILKDPVEAYSRRAALAARRQEALELVNMLKTTYGRRIDSANPFAELTDEEVVFAPEGFTRMYRMKVALDDAILRRIGQGEEADSVIRDVVEQTIVTTQDELQRRYGGQIGITTRDIEMWAIPRVVADRIQKSVTPHFGTNMRLFYDTPMHAWRAIVLQGSPRWVVNNLLGNTMFVKLQGARLSDMLRYLNPRWRRKVRAMIGKGPLESVESTFVESLTEPHLGSALDTRVGQGLTRLSQTRVAKRVTSVGNAMKRLNTFVENAARTASYLTAAEKVAAKAGIRRSVRGFFSSRKSLESVWRVGLDENLWTKAVDEMNSFMNDYSHMTPFGRQVMRRFVMPFWAFYRHAARLILTFPFTHPERFNVLQQLSLIGQEMARDQGPVPEWAEGALKLGPGDQPGETRFLSLAGPNPFSQVTEALSSVGQGRLGPLAQSFNPALKVMFEQATGRSTLTGQPFSDPAVVSGSPFSDDRYRVTVSGSGEALVTPVGTVTPSLAEHLAQQIPQYELLKDILAGGRTYDTSTIWDVLRPSQPGVIRDPVTGTARYPVTLAQSGARFFGFSTFDVDQLELLRRQRDDQLTALRAALRRYGLLPPYDVAPEVATTSGSTFRYGGLT